MLYAALTLLAVQYTGDMIAETLSLPVPGVVIGLLLLLLVLAFRGRRLGPERAVPDTLSRVAKGLHDHFGLLFVPAGAGVVANVGRLATEGVALVIVLLLSTIATMAVTALIVAGRRGAVAVEGMTGVEQHGT